MGHPCQIGYANANQILVSRDMDKKNLTSLKGVGQKLVDKLNGINVFTKSDLILHFPKRYLDKTKVIPISSIKIDEYALIDAEIVKVNVQGKPKPSMTIEVQDHSGYMHLRWFKYYPQQRQQFAIGDKIRCFGKIQFFGHSKYMAHPEYKIYKDGETIDIDECLTPVYATINGLHQKTLIKIIKQTLNELSETNKLDNMFPELKITYKEAVENIHFCKNKENSSVYKKRLALEEMLAHHLSYRSVKEATIKRECYIIPTDCNIKNKLIKSLPYSLTNAQNRVVEEILNDINQPVPMMRLVQGDVGSGKTIVAMFAALMAVQRGVQVAIMAPTEILSVQHYENFSSWCEPFDIKVCLYTGKLTPKQKRDMVENIAMGVQQIVIGTHALFQDSVVFNQLGMVIIDEQHRFGVNQREKLLSKGSYDEKVPHLLVMTATPIPRTLALIFYADLNSSIIDELPPTRKPVKTIAVSNTRRDEVLDKVKAICNNGQQVYWVCPFIEESEILEGQAVEIVVSELQEHLAPLKVGLIHGRCTNDEKDRVMGSFKRNEINVLCATTVIEVGVDVPNASLMVIENPERMGLSQLHQLRGRVGRGNNNSYCILLYQNGLTQIARERIEIMRSNHDGFKIAELDLELRGPGEMFGTKQTGVPGLKIADLKEDLNLLPKVQKMADEIVEKAPGVGKEIVEKWFFRDKATNVL